MLALEGETLILSLISPLVLAVALWLMQRVTNRETWKREDAVRLANEERQDRLEANVTAAKEQAEAAAALLVRNNELVAHSTTLMSLKIDGVHDLVNSDKTEAMRVLLDQFVLNLEMIKELKALHANAGDDVAGKSSAAIKAAEARIETLTSEIAERDRLQAIADAQPQQIFPSKTERGMT